MKCNHRHLGACLSLALFLASSLSAASPEKIKISNRDDLPRYNYTASGSLQDMLAEAPAFDPLAAQLRRDLEDLLARYEIADKPTLREYLGGLQALDMLENRWDAALARTRQIRDLQEKPADKLTSGLSVEAALHAWRQNLPLEGRRAAFANRYRELIQPLPWEVVRDNIQQTKGAWEVRSRNFYLGILQAQFEPAIAKTGQLSGDIAQALVGFRFQIEMLLPFKDEIVSVLTAYIDEHRVAKPDIWKDRNIDLTGRPQLTPVIIAIWDSGVDYGNFPGLLWNNPGETPNGQDDDHNGFIDDLHGFGYDLHSRKTNEALFPIPAEKEPKYSEMKELMKGWLDIRANLDTAEARFVKKKMAQVEASQMKDFIEDLGLFGNYAHGTHVAGIAAAGNPAARLLNSRLTFDFQAIPEPPTFEDTLRGATAARETVAYFKKAGVRVVNMSWGGNQQGIETALEANGIGDDPAMRREMARVYFQIQKEALREAMASAPEILFIPAAGNSDSDVNFIDDVPACIELPNVLAVGAVDQAGEETSFTSFGQNVKVHASGFEVESTIPRGEHMKLSGTSMAAPQVANLAGKLLALDPTLTTGQLISLIRLGCETSSDGRRFLLNPKRSVALLQTLRKQSME